MNTKSFLWAFSLPLFLLTVGSTIAQVPKAGSGRDAANFIPMRERVKMMEEFWAWKSENLLPKLMREQGVDMWIVRYDEEPLYQQTNYREHPVYVSLLPATHEGMAIPSKTARSGMDVPKILLFYDTGNEIEYVEVTDYAQLPQLVKDRDPQKIAISMKNLYVRRQKFGNTDQISIVTSDDMQKALGRKYASRTVDSWYLGILWLSIIGPEQRSAYRYVQGVHNDIIAEAFSNKVIIPNKTTIEDLNWWMRDRYLDLHLGMDNHPTVIIKRRPSKIAEYKESAKYFRNGSAGNGTNVIIRRGDVISLDSDILMLGLETDSHQHAYVLLEGEADVPDDLKDALRIVNDIQDTFRKEFKVGRTQREIIDACDKIPRDPKIIHSSSGFHPPPMFIRRFSQNGLLFSQGVYVAGMGRGYKQHPLLSPDIKLHYNTLYAFEPHTSIAVPGWGEQGLEIGVGQIAVFTENGLEYLDRPMLEWHVVK